VTQNVKLRSLLETQGPLHYNVHVSNARVSGRLLPLVAIVAAPLLTGGACEKKNTTTNPDPGAITALDHAGSDTVDTSPLKGVDMGKLDADKQQVFYRLLGSLSSPCGKAHSLRTSFTSDQECKRAPYAVKYLVALLEDAESETQARDMWEKKYKGSSETFKFDLSKEPHVGPDDAPIRIVEFYDYGCPHCAEFKPMLDHVIEKQKEKGRRVVVYFMHFNLGHFANSKEAAQAALAAAAQHKFKEMHDLLFEHQGEHKYEQLVGYAKEIGLDMAKFEADYNAAGVHVDAQKAQGDAAGVQSTPSIFLNEKRYDAPLGPRYFDMWIDEELSVNR
jgi:protein-disulfide isomerase